MLNRLLDFPKAMPVYACTRERRTGGLIDERGIMRSFSVTAERLFGWTAIEAV